MSHILLVRILTIQSTVLVIHLLVQFDNAKTTFLKACIRSPSCVSWLGAGIACYRVSEQ